MDLQAPSPARLPGCAAALSALLGPWWAAAQRRASVLRDGQATDLAVSLCLGITETAVVHCWHIAVGTAVVPGSPRQAAVCSRGEPTVDVRWCVYRKVKHACARSAPRGTVTTG